jgi:hypothetical protein
MTSDIRTDATVNAASGVERDAKIELLLAGLDHYFASQCGRRSTSGRARSSSIGTMRALACISRPGVRRPSGENQAAARRRRCVSGGDGREAAPASGGARCRAPFEHVSDARAVEPARCGDTPAILRARNVGHALPVLCWIRPPIEGVAHVRIRADRRDGPG